MKCDYCGIREGQHGHLDDDGDGESGPNPNAELLSCCGSKGCCPLIGDDD